MTMVWVLGGTVAGLAWLVYRSRKRQQEGTLLNMDLALVASKLSYVTVGKDHIRGFQDGLWIDVRTQVGTTTLRFDWPRRAQAAIIDVVALKAALPGEAVFSSDEAVEVRSQDALNTSVARVVQRVTDAVRACVVEGDEAVPLLVNGLRDVEGPDRFRLCCLKELTKGEVSEEIAEAALAFASHGDDGLALEVTRTIGDWSGFAEVAKSAEPGLAMRALRDTDAPPEVWEILSRRLLAHPTEASLTLGCQAAARAESREVANMVVDIIVNKALVDEYPQFAQHAVLAVEHARPEVAESALRRLLDWTTAPPDVVDALGRLGSITSVPALRAWGERESPKRADKAIHLIQSRAEGEVGGLGLADEGAGQMSVVDKEPS